MTDLFRSLRGSALASGAAISLVVALISQCTAATEDVAVKAGAPKATVDLSSSGFKEGKTIPKEFTADGKDESPPLKWTGVPAEAKSLALICDDPDAPVGTWVHWVIYDLPAGSQELAGSLPTRETLPSGARQGLNSWKNVGWGGPSPPPGKPHRYFFKLYALDKKLDLAAGADKQKLLAAMKDHVLAQAKLMGTYGR